MNKRLNLILLWSISTVIILFFGMPYLWMAGSAFKPYADIFASVSPVTIWTFLPQHPTLENFVSVFTEQNFGRYLFNSLLVAFAQVLGTLLICSVAAFALTRVNFSFRDKVFVFILATFLIPFDAIVIPLYMTVRSIGLQDTYWGFFVPWIFSPFGIFLLKQVFEEIPKELDEAAIVDGATPFQIYWKVILPNAVPGLVTLALITFLFSWDAFFWPLVIMSDEKKQLITVFIAKQTTSQMQFWGNIFAAVFTATVPVVTFFVAMQRHYIRGITTTGLKG